MALVLVAALVGGCAAKTNALPPGTADADKFLFDRGSASAKDRKWLDAREYFRNLVDNYPQSPYRPDAKLALGDTYISEGSTESLLLGANEFREFLTFYPTHPRADYAQLQLARSFTEQMLGPERDQSATKDAIKEIEIFLQRFPNSKLIDDARKMERQARDRLSEAGYRVGYFYYRNQVLPRRDRSIQGSAQDRSGLYQSRRRLLPPCRIALSKRAEPRRRGAPLLRAFAERIRKVRLSRSRAKTCSRIENIW